MLVDSRYDRIVGSNEIINEFYREEILKEKYLGEAEFLEAALDSENLNEEETKKLKMLIKTEKIKRRYLGEDDNMSMLTTTDYNGDDNVSTYSMNLDNIDNQMQGPRGGAMI